MSNASSHLVQNSQFDNSVGNADAVITQQSTTFLRSLKSIRNEVTTEDKEREMKENIMILGLQRPSMVADKDRKTCLFYPNDKFKIMFWDILISVCLLFTCILIPFNMAFSD